MQLRKRKTVIVSFYVLSVPIVQNQEKEEEEEENRRTKMNEKKERSACNSFRQKKTLHAHTEEHR